MPRALPRIARPRAMIAWTAGTGLAATPFDDLRGRWLADRGIAWNAGRDQPRAYAPPAVPQLDLTLDNHDGTFSPEAGPLAGFVGRGPTCTLDMEFGESIPADDPDTLADDPGVLANGLQTVRRFDGTVDDAPQDTAVGTPSTAVTALGTLLRLAETRVWSTFQQDIRIDQAIAYVLTQCGIPPERQVLDVAATTLPRWWANGETGLALLGQLLATEGAGAASYEDGGFVHFEGRQFRLNTPRSITAQAHLWDTYAGAASTAGGPIPSLYHVRDSGHRSNPEEVVKSVSTTIDVRNVQPLQKVWEHGGPLVLAPGETLDTQVKLGEPVTGAVAPQAGTDYVVAAGSLASVPTLVVIFAQQVHIRWVAGAGGATVNGATSNGPQLRATPWTVAYVHEQRNTNAFDFATSRYRGVDRQLDVWPEISRNQALDLVNSWYLRYYRPRTQMTVRLANVDGEHQRMMLRFRTSDKVTIHQGQLGVGHDFYVEQLRHELGAGGAHQLTLSCERAYDFEGMRFGTGQFGPGQFAE